MAPKDVPVLSTDTCPCRMSSSTSSGLRLHAGPTPLPPVLSTCGTSLLCTGQSPKRDGRLRSFSGPVLMMQPPLPPVKLPSVPCRGVLVGEL